MISDVEISRLKSLWAAVVQRALEDAKDRHSGNGVRARRWIFSDDNEVCSFNWVCEDALGVSAFAARQRIRELLGV